MSVSVYGDAKDVQFAPTREKVEALGRKIIKVSGPLAVTMGLKDVNMVDVVRVGEQRLASEVLSMNGNAVPIQVYEEAFSLGPGAVVEATSVLISVELGSGTIENIYGGIQYPLEGIMWKAGNSNLLRGMEVSALDREKRWDFATVARSSDRVTGGDVLGTVQETSVVFHKIVVSPTLSGAIESTQFGSFAVLDTVAVLVDGKRGKHTLIMVQKQPVRVGQPYKRKCPPRTPLLFSQHIMDVMFLVAKGGTATIPGSFGLGKTVMQRQLAKWSDAGIVVHIDYGERDNEMIDVLWELPELVDPRAGESLMKQAALIVNTSGMPVVTREVSIYTDITTAEYFRNIGCDVAVVAGSISHWIEALREVSGRLGEMPGEEGYPIYLSSRLAQFYERAGMVECIGPDGHHRGSLIAVGAVSSPGGDLSEPVSQATVHVVKVFWVLGVFLTYKRHFPVISWLNSYSLYLNSLKPWYNEHLGPQFTVNRDKVMSILQGEASPNEIVQLVGKDSLSATDQLTLETTKMPRGDFLQQSGFTEASWYSSCKRQNKMVRMIPDYDKLCRTVIERGATTTELFAIPLREQTGRVKSMPDDRHAVAYADIAREMEEQITNIAVRGGVEE